VIKSVARLKTDVAALVALISIFIASVFAPAFAEDGKKVVQQLVKVFVDSDPAKGGQPAYGEAAKYIDYQTMSERALGQARWKTLSSTQKSEFVEDFRRLIEKRYYPRWQRIFAAGQISYLDETISGRDVLVKTSVNTADSAQVVIWTVSQSGPEGRVISLKVGERDLLKRAALRFQKKLAKGDFKDFLAWLKKESVRSSKSESGDSD
jgi:ABC-type transporter MlaC component